MNFHSNPQTMKNLVQIAAQEIGVTEIAGEEDNPIVVKYAKEAGFKDITDDETPWCSVFINWCCKEADLQRTHKANARSWLYIGLPVDDPAPGDIVVFWRDHPQSWQGHVGIFMGYSKDMSQVFTLGGNQRNSVSIQGYDANKVLGFRRLTTEGNLEIPKPILQLGDTKEEVVKLQIILIELGYDCGSKDGVFGPRTEKQLKAMQRHQNQLDNGIYDDKMKAVLENIFQS